jgi:hypothetical protein
VLSQRPPHHYNIRFQIGGGGERGLGFDSLPFYGVYPHAVTEIQKEVASETEESLGGNHVVILCPLGL